MADAALYSQLYTYYVYSWNVSTCYVAKIETFENFPVNRKIQLHVKQNSTTREYSWRV